MDVLMPQLGETVAEGKITKWFKSSGDTVKPGDNLFEIETDKVSMEVPSTTAGVLKEIRVAAGEIAPVGAIVAIVAGDGAAPSPPALSTASPSPKVQQNSPAAPSTIAPVPGAAAPIKLDPFFEVRTPASNYGRARLAGGAVVTPLARRLAAEAGIKLDAVRGSEPGGRIGARDVEAARAPAGRSRTMPLAGLSAAAVRALYRGRPFEEVPLESMRAAIARRVIEAKQTIPHFYLTADVEVGPLIALREEANALAPKDAAGAPAYRLSINDFVIKSWAAALQRLRAANAVWAEDRILRFQHSDIAVAVAIDGGLLMPVIRDAEMKSLTAISAEMREVAERTRARRLDPSEYQGGSSAISNLGMYGVREFAAVISPPQATILAVGAARRQAVEKKDGGVAFASMMTVTLSCDHRVIDGTLGAQVLESFKEFIEQPLKLLV
ncbi:MAG TPA: dihydrolipoamide acetyltransferase family protein [Xanthobacteraceae bacterium]|jgi:pyruvate dehydrogenase E2 component (dihydrolipoamide acetyltransferase)